MNFTTNIRICVASVTLLAVSILGAQQRGAATRMEGVILDAATGGGLGKVVLTVAQGATRRETTTDAQGGFGLDVPSGTVELFGTREGYVDLRLTARHRPGILFTLSPGQRLRDLTFRMTPAGTITGRVLDTQGKPVSNARAGILRDTYDDNGARGLQPVNVLGGATNDGGEFQLSGIEPGRYFLAVHPPLFKTSSTGDPLLTVYYPGTEDEFRAEPIEVKSGQETRLEDLREPSERGGMIRVRMVNQTGVTPDTRDQKWVHWRLAGTRGESVMVHPLLLGGIDRVEIPVTPGKYDIAVGWTTARGEPIGIGQAKVEVGRSDTPVSIAIPKSAGVLAHAQLEASAGTSPPLAGVRCELHTNEAGGAPPIPAISFTSQADGSMTASSVPPGTYRVECPSPPAGAYLRQIRQGDRDVMKDGLLVDGSNAEFTASFSTGGGSVQGTVTDANGQKVHGAVVTLVPDDEDRALKYLFRPDITDQKGTFTIRPIPPGPYHLFAWAEMDGAAYKNADFLKKFESQGTSVKVDRGGKQTVDLKVLDENSPGG